MRFQHRRDLSLARLEIFVGAFQASGIAGNVIGMTLPPRDRIQQRYLHLAAGVAQ